MDEAHEVDRRPLLRGHIEVDRLALLARARDARVARLVDVRRRGLAATVLQILELRRSVPPRVATVLLTERLADLALVHLRSGLRQVLLLDHAERVRTLIRHGVDDVD